MIQANDEELVISFPELDDEANLRIYFSKVDAFNENLRIRSFIDQSVELAGCGRFVVHLRPENRFSPFAVVMCVDNRNVITGDDSMVLRRDPQNYFATPPQGGIDGYFLDGHVLPFHVGPAGQAHPSSLAIKAFPIGREALEFWKYNRSLSGNPHYLINDLTLAHGGPRQCEPIYEDMCSIGDWDTRHSEEFAVRLIT